MDQAGMRALGVTRVAVLPDPLIVRLAGTDVVDGRSGLSHQPRDFVGVGTSRLDIKWSIAFADLFVVLSSRLLWNASTWWTTGPLFVALGHVFVVCNGSIGRRAVVCGLEAPLDWKPLGIWPPTRVHLFASTNIRATCSFVSASRTVLFFGNLPMMLA